MNFVCVYSNARYNTKTNGTLNDLTDGITEINEPRWHTSHMSGFFVSITSLIRRNFEAIAALTPFNWFLDKSKSCWGEGGWKIKINYSDDGLQRKSSRIEMFNWWEWSGVRQSISFILLKGNEEMGRKKNILQKTSNERNIYRWCQRWLPLNWWETFEGVCLALVSLVSYQEQKKSF